MLDVESGYNVLKDLPVNILAIIVIIILVIYYLHIRKKNQNYNDLKSQYEITIALNKDSGHVTIYPLSVKRIKNGDYKYIYLCSLQINANQKFPEGFNMTLSSSEKFLIKLNNSSVIDAQFKKPKYCADINSDFFKMAENSITRINSLEFEIYSRKKLLDLDVSVNFGPGLINSKVFFNT